MYTQASAAYKRFEHCLQNNMYTLLYETWQKQQIHAHTTHNTHPYTHMNMVQLMYKFYKHMTNTHKCRYEPWSQFAGGI